jgi:endonuclease-8
MAEDVFFGRPDFADAHGDERELAYLSTWGAVAAGQESSADFDWDGKIVAVAFNVPVAEFHSAETLERRLRRVGPSMLADELDERAILENLRRRGEAEVGAALLEQSVLAGIGNVFKSEVCFGCGVNPFRRVDTLTIQEAACLMATARKFMLANVGENSGDGIVTYTGMRRTTGRSMAEERLWVYRRRGAACRRCGTAIEMRRQMPGARSTYWCPQCQPMAASRVG